MASSVSDAIRVSKLLGFDYTKFENTKLAAEKRKSSGETNKMRNKKILVSPVRGYRGPLESGSKSIEGEEVRNKSGRRSVPSDKLNTSKLLKRCSSETKEINKAKCDENGQVLKKVSVEKNKSHLEENPLMEVRKKLDFKDELEDDIPALRKGLDFTDKIAALRSLIHRDRETKDISDRRAYYDEYQGKPRKVMVARSDSFKENHELNDRRTVNSGPDNKTSHSQTRRIHSADIFKDHRLIDGRLSAVDLHIVKEKLRDKRIQKVGKDVKQVEDINNNSKDELFDKNDNALTHVKRGRKVIAARPRKTELMEGDSRPSSRLDSKETQTSVLNQSIRSVQSNAPLYESLGRPASAPVLQCGISVSKRSVFTRNRINDTEGIECGVKTNLVQSDRGKDERQTNLEEFVGTSLTPEKHRKTRPHSGATKLASDSVRRSNAESTERRHSSGNHRPSSRNDRNNEARKTPEIFSSSHRKTPEIPSVSHRKTPEIHSASHKDRRSSDIRIDNVVQNGEVSDKHKDKNTEKSERKVREWIKNQQMLNSEQLDDNKPQDSGPMLMDELSISISVPAGTGRKIESRRSDGFHRSPSKHEKREKMQPLNSTPAYGIITAKDGHSGAPYDSKAIFDRLEHITMAVVTQQHQLEVEIPMKDIQIKRESHRSNDLKKGMLTQKSVGRDSPVKRMESDSPVRLVESDTTSTGKLWKMHLVEHQLKTAEDRAKSVTAGSSVFSVPFSLRSADSASSTCQAVKLLRRLYNVDADTRQDLVLLAKCFRRWFNNVLHAKARNVQILQAAKRVSPVSYGVMLRKSDVCHTTNVLLYYFKHWRTAARNQQLHNQVARLHRRHTLQKGMNAFKWAINRSKLQQGILQDRVNNMLLQSIFTKWRVRTLENRRLHLQQAFLRWRQFTKEAQKIRMLRNQTNLRLKEKIFLEWNDAYRARMKQHKADRHARHCHLIHSWRSWRCFIVLSKEKKQREAAAVQMLQITVQRKMFTCMKVEFVKYTQAKQFHKMRQLKVAIRDWRSGSVVSRSERQDDVRVAAVYWSRSSLRTTFTLWRDTLLNNKACRQSHHNMTRNAFTMWKKRYTELIERRRAVDSYIRKKVQTRAFQHWYTFVVIMKQRRAAAIECLQSVLQRRMFEHWRWYTGYRKHLRKRLILHNRKNNLDTERRYLSMWRSYFKVKCDAKKAQQLWSNSCAKKASERWRLVCHRRQLARRLIDTEPDRQLNKQRVLLMRWKERFDVIMEEKQAAADVRCTLNISQLRIHFEKWHTATQQLLLIKPMVLHYKKQLITQCFIEWRHYVVHKAECLKSEQALLLLRMRNKFTTWKRQHQVQQLQKDYSQKLDNRHAQHCLHAWLSVIQRKHQAIQFRNNHLVKAMFYHWNTRSLRQLREKRLQKVEMEAYMNTIREYFSHWRTQLYHQQTQDEENTVYLQQHIQYNQVKMAFSFWRRHFRATLVARENEKIRVRKLAKQALQAWHQHTQDYLEDAVEKFAIAIGLSQADGDANIDTDHPEIDTAEKYDVQQILGHGESIETVNFEFSSTPKSSHTPLTPRTPRTPRHTSAFGTPLRRLDSPSLSQHSLTQSLDLDSPGALISSGFLDARFEMEHAVKTANRREIVVTAVSRIRHWPVSIMFEQWREYTARQHELKHLSTQMIPVQQQLVTRRFFTAWTHHYTTIKLAKQHYEQVLQHKALLSLILYRNSRLQKKHLNNIAGMHYARKVYSENFPVWLAKAQEKQHSQRIVHLWTNITDEERELIPRERSFRYKLNKKSLSECFTIWRDKYRRIYKLKKVYHNVLYNRYFNVWYSWATERHRRNILSQQFRDNRRTKLVWRTWCLRQTQKLEVEKRYKNAWQNDLLTVLHAWHHWARDERMRKQKAVYIVQTRQQHLVANMFTVWKQETRKREQVIQWHHDKLMSRVLGAWRYVARWQKDLKQRELQCQWMSYTYLAKRAFKQWLSCYEDRLVLQHHHDQIVETRVLRMALHWKRKAQKSRGENLRQHFHVQHMRGVLSKWKAAYNKNLTRYEQLEEYQGRKSCELTGRYLEVWRTELMCIQAQRVFTMKLMTTFLAEWKHAAKGCHERRNALQKYTAHKTYQTQRVHFLYWYNVAKARKSIRGHANLKMQLTVFKAWLLYTRKQINLRRLEANFTRTRNLRIIKDRWYLMKTRFDYCVEMSEMANGVIHEKNSVLMRQSLQHWHFRLQIVIADECYQHILAKRTANRWCRFVVRKQQQRQHIKQQMEKAAKYYNQKLCNKVYIAWFKQVLATRHNERRKARLCRKYALLWKHRADLSYTAKCIRNEKLYAQAWKIWHLEFVRRMTIKKVEAFEKKQQLTMVFVSWKNLSRKRSRRLSSMIPLPVSPAYNMPSACSSGSSTPTDELNPPYSPVFNKPSQIPQPHVKRKKSLSARSSPTGSLEKLTPYQSGRRGSIY